MQAMWARFSGTVAFGAVDILSRLRPGLGPAGQAAQSECHRFALARALPHGLGRMLAKHLPQGCHYFNTGHSNLSHRVLRALKLHVGARVVVHDTIPLDFPQFQRPGTPQAFAAMLARVRQIADVILCNSHQTKTDIARHTPPGTALPRCVVAPLGIDVPRPAPSWPKPPALAPDRPYFMAIGTIEPRKNHEFLLRIWAKMAQQGSPLPALLICGARGWNNAQVFGQLDGHPMMCQHVFELNCLADAQMAAALQGAVALLHPSHAEGYGLPPNPGRGPWRACGLPAPTHLPRNSGADTRLRRTTEYIFLDRNNQGAGRQWGKRWGTGATMPPIFARNMAGSFQC